MKKKSLLTILIVVVLSIMVLCCFSYGSSHDAQNSVVFEQGFSMFGKAHSFDCKERSFVIDDSGKLCSISIPKDYKIIIDGSLGSFESIELIANYKNITISTPGNNTRIVYIQTIPKVFSGTILQIENKDGYLFISVYSNALSMVFCVEKENFPGDIIPGDYIQFIPDGCKIIEVVKE